MTPARIVAVVFALTVLIPCSAFASGEASKDATPSVDAGASTHLVILDARVTGASELIKAIPLETPIYQLRAELDGVDEISDILRHYEGLTAIHIIARGEVGSLRLGSQLLDRFALAAKGHRIERWGRALAPDADLLLYSSNVAQGIVGAQFVELLASITGADVAASNNNTGNPKEGGDWLFEFSSGAVEAEPMFSEANAGTFEGLLISQTLKR